jgi:hypothetical protein
MVRLPGQSHPVSRLRGRGPLCGAVRLFGVLGRQAPMAEAANRGSCREHERAFRAAPSQKILAFSVS